MNTTTTTTSNTTTTRSFRAEEYAGSMLGVAGRFYPRHAIDADGATFSSQKWISERRPIAGYGKGGMIQATLRFDDECKNGHNTFSATADITALDGRGRREWVGGGAAHDAIAKAFPELAGLLRWHLTSSDGPLHYVANAVYHAGNRDHFGRIAGQASSFADVVYFGDIPAAHRLKGKLAPFLRDVLERDADGIAEAMDVVTLPYQPKAGTRDYAFAPKYAFAGMNVTDWHDGPFDTEEEAARFADSVRNHRPRIGQIATAWSEGKARDLDAARRTAVWPEATDEELSVEPAELRAVLEARGPRLLEQFRCDMEAAGFAWRPSEYVAPRVAVEG